MQIIKVGTTQLTLEEVKKYFEDNKAIVNYSGVWTIHYSVAQQEYTTRKVSNIKGLASRGRFYAMKPSELNNLIGYQLLWED